MFDIKENLKKLPETPGVYMHKDSVGRVIYVGKAVNLKRRVSSYFVNSSKHSAKVKAMVTNIAEFEYINCKTEMEALILECNLIKKYAPKYNVLLRDDKTYPYIKVTTNEEFPRVLKTRAISKDKAKYFGPYSDASAVNQTIELLNKIYRLKRCSSKGFTKDYKPCLNYHIKECRGVCTGLVDKDEYMSSVDSVLEFLSGKHKKVRAYAAGKMNEASASMNFEEAAAYRDYISAIDSLSSMQRVTMVNGKDIDMVLPCGKNENTSVVLFTVRDGKLSGRETFSLSTMGDEDYDTVMSGFIKQYYVNMAIAPHDILVPEPLREAELIEEYLSKDYHVRIYTPERGDKRALLDLAKRDVDELSKTLEAKLKNAEEKENELRSVLLKLTGKEKDLYRIESYDISNTNGVDTVGAMVVFSNLKPVKKEYRRFKIRTVEGPDDYGALQEMLYRRFKRCLEGDKSFSELPDLILMDGGLGQVTAALKVIHALKLEVPVIGMAKDDSHRTRALVNHLGDEFDLKEYPFLFKYCGTVQEEVHRFAIDYHHNLHNRNTISSILDEIPGIGPKKRTVLLTHFKSVDEIKMQTPEALRAVPGITEKNAADILAYLNKTLT